MTPPIIRIKGELALLHEPGSTALDVDITVDESEAAPVIEIRTETGTCWVLRLAPTAGAFLAGSLARQSGADVFIRPGRS